MNRGLPVTVVVPNYNHARYLPQRLESILTQTYQNFELIVLDDASTDNSLAVLRPYVERGHIRLEINKQNSGSPFAQWARGANLARGELLWIAESDDYADPHLLERLVAAFSMWPQTGLAYCQSWQVDSEGNVGASCEEMNHWLDPARWAADYTNNGRDEVAHYLSIQNTIPNASAALLRTNLLRHAISGADDLRLTGDWRTWINLLLESDVAFVAESLNYFRVHGQSVRYTTRVSRATAECLAVQAYACRVARVPLNARRRAFEREYPHWMRGLNAEGLKARVPWMSQTIANTFRVWPLGALRMLGAVLIILLQRTFRRVLQKVTPTDC